MKNLTSPLLFLALIAVTSCSSPSDNPSGAQVTSNPDTAHNSQNSLDWQGIYEGVLPCGSCEGIKTQVTLNEDGSFKRIIEYLGENSGTITDTGEFSWTSDGSKVSISDESGVLQKFIVGENKLISLDKDGNQITGDLEANYILKKRKTDPMLEDKKWRLVELNGVPVKLEEGKEAFISFNSAEQTYFGNNACNAIRGSYKLDQQSRMIIISEGMSTLMACPDMKTPKYFTEAIGGSNLYSYDGKQLNFSKAGGAVHMRFENITEEE